MKNQVYILVALVFAFTGLTSFNPQTQSEGTITLASSKKPAKKLSKAQQAALEKEQLAEANRAEAAKKEALRLENEVRAKLEKNLFAQSFTLSAGNAVANSTPVVIESKDGKTYKIQKVEPILGAKAKSTGARVYKMSSSTEPVSLNQVKVYLVEVPSTNGTVCTSCLPSEIHSIVRSDIDFAKLVDGDEDNFKTLIEAGKSIVAELTKKREEALAKKEADEKDCKYESNSDKLACAEKNYELAKTKEGKRKYANIFKKAAFWEAEHDGSASDLCDRVNDYAYDRESRKSADLYSISKTACKLSMAYTARPVWNRFTGSYEEKNAFEIYEARLNDKIQYHQQMIDNWNYLGNQRQANEEAKMLQNDIYNISREYRGWLRQSFGSNVATTANGINYGLSSTDYARMIGPFVNTASIYADQNTDLKGLAVLANDTTLGFEGRRSNLDLNFTAEKRCYDSNNPSITVPCSSLTSPTTSIVRAPDRSHGPFDGRAWLNTSLNTNNNRI